jgi:zinc protease
MIKLFQHSRSLKQFSTLRIVVTIIGFFSLPVTASAASADLAIETFMLKNGMQVVLIPNHRMPVVTHLLVYRVGGADDYPGRSGLAHYNEHMMFQGTKTVPAGEFAHTITNNGGNFNAFTTRDYTGYFVTIARANLPMVMELEADRMLNLAPDQGHFSKEREVIIEERRMTIENQPSSLLAEEMQALMFRNHPYHNPLIGWMQEMQALLREDVLAFHHQFYHPANAVLVVAGDITRSDLQALAEKYYGNLPRGELNVRHWRVEPPQRGARHIELRHKNVKQPELVRYYIAPGANSEDKGLMMPEFVLAQLMGGGTTSSMYQSLVVKQKIATSVDFSYDGISIGPAMLEIRAVPASGVSLPQLEAALDKEIATALINTGTDEDIKRAKILLKADTTYARDGMEGMARIVGGLIMAGLPVDYFNQWPKLVDAVNATDIHKAAAATFNSDASVTGYLLPEKDSQ